MTVTVTPVTPALVRLAWIADWIAVSLALTTGTLGAGVGGLTVRLLTTLVTPFVPFAAMSSLFIRASLRRHYPGQVRGVARDLACLSAHRSRGVRLPQL